MKLMRVGDSHEIDAEVISRDGSAIRVRIGNREVAAEFTPNADGGGILSHRRAALCSLWRAAQGFDLRLSWAGVA